MFQVLTFFFGKDVLLKLILQLISTHSIFLEAEECLELCIVSSVANFGKILSKIVVNLIAKQIGLSLISYV